MFGFAGVVKICRQSRFDHRSERVAKASQACQFARASEDEDFGVAKSVFLPRTPKKLQHAGAFQLITNMIISGGRRVDQR